MDERKAAEDEALGLLADPQQHIMALTAAKIRAFLFEVAEGVSSYRSLHSLTEQVEHQYHGRFLIELIQNAHDALPESPTSNQTARIAVVLDLEDSQHGTLLVANDGQPFTRTNFERLSALGQSDKDPQKSIGNKGLGFRSVLEVSERPEVYSRASATGVGFNGYCFAFEPKVVQELKGPMEALAAGGPVPACQVTGEPIVDWAEALLDKFRRRVQAAEAGWLAAETRFLSPYLLPVPRRQLQGDAVKALEAKGFMSVIRLPLKSDAATKLVREHMAQLNPTTLLFLERVRVLELTGAAPLSRVIRRETAPGTGALARRTVRLSDGDADTRNYEVWTRPLRIADASEDIRAAVKALPGRWPEIEDVSVSVAVRKSGEPEAGAFSIYLPTGVSTGAAVHINAPFFGNMSRTDISFNDGYNCWLLNTAAGMVVEVVRGQLAGRQLDEARMVLDMLAPYGSDEAAKKRWAQLVDAAFQHAKVSFDDEALALADRGWRKLGTTSLVPDTSRLRLIDEGLLRKHATFDAFHAGLVSRTDQIKALATSRPPPRDRNVPTHELAATVAKIAENIRREDGDWNVFWQDVALLLPQGQEALANQHVIIGNDGLLHKASDERVFFVPRQGTDDDSDIGSDGATIDVPASLQSTVAFLHESITVYEPDSRPARQTAVRKYLATGLVTQFRLEAIFTGTLKDSTPELPAKLPGPEAERCLAILRWALSMIRSAVARERGSDAVMALLRPIPVPCRGGWYPMSKASFGAGWLETAGNLLSSYLDAVPGSVAEGARSRLLVPPDDPAWDGLGASSLELLRRGGVFDGLRLETLKPENWSNAFHASVTAFDLPSAAPPGFDEPFWASYRSHIESTLRGGFQGLQPYNIGTLHHFPGMGDGHLPDSAREGLCELVLRSLTKWGDGLEQVSFSKRGGQADRRLGLSPLKYFLQTRAWLAPPGERDTLKWSRPAERWHVPAQMIDRRSSHFAHLRALPHSLARRLEADPGLASALHQLGMPFLDPDRETSDPKLLRELISAIDTDNAPDTNVLLGQIRDAWHRFRPQSGQVALEHLPVRSRAAQLLKNDMNNGQTVYLPDLGTLADDLEQFGVNVLTLDPKDAKALQDWFVTTYGERVVLTSKLKLVPRVDHASWSGESAELLSKSPLGWLTEPLLTLVAFHRQTIGVHAQAFRERVEVLRKMRVAWVERIELVVMSHDVEVMRIDVPAHWDSSRKTLLVSGSARAKPDSIARAIAQSIDRDDLELPLRLLLCRLASIEDGPENLEVALAELQISRAQFESVRQHLRGDVGHAAELLQVMCEILQPGCDSAGLMKAETDDDLAAAVAAIAPLGAPTQELIRRATVFHDDFDFGLTLFRSMGQSVALPLWNAALGRLGRQTLANRDWQQQLNAHLEEASGCAKRIAAHLLREPDSVPYKDMLARYDDLGKMDSSMAYDHWEIGFQTAMKLVGKLVKDWAGGTKIADVLMESESLDSLRGGLAALGVDLSIDPDERCRANHQCIENFCEGIDRFRQAWWLNNSEATASFGAWRSLREDLVGHAKASFGDRAYSQSLTEVDVFADLRQSALELRSPPSFFTCIEACQDLASLRSCLGITDQELNDADARLAAQRADALRRRQVVQVCGEDFDASDENRSLLWDFLLERVDFQRLAAESPMDLGQLVELLPAEIGKARERKETLNPRPTKPPQRQPKAVDELIGLSGEIYVFEMLRRRYGKDVVTATSWISSNSLYVFKDNAPDDGAGCDFAFSSKGRSYKVEVKASAGNALAFTLGSSEIALAKDLAKQKKGRRDLFVLVHVRNALSDSPDPVILPNPYGPRGKHVFRIEEADARIRYHVKS